MALLGARVSRGPGVRPPGTPQRAGRSRKAWNLAGKEKPLFAGRRMATGGALVQDALERGNRRDRRESDGWQRARRKRVTCEDCFFHQNMLCALNLDEPAPPSAPPSAASRPSASSRSRSAPSARARRTPFPSRSSNPAARTRRWVNVATCGSPCSASRRRGRTSAGPARATCSSRTARRSCSTAATACSRRCASFVDYVDVDAVVISHLHADHFLDLVPFSYALTYAPRQQPVPGAAAGPAPTTPRGRCSDLRRPGRSRSSAGSWAPGATRI